MKAEDLIDAGLLVLFDGLDDRFRRAHGERARLDVIGGGFIYTLPPARR